MARHPERGFTLIELMVVVATLGILSAIVAHHVLRAKAAANESSAIATLRAMSTGETAFATSCGAGGYSASIAKLADGRFISEDVSLPLKSGFIFTLTGGAGQQGPIDCAGEATGTAFYATAEPAHATAGTRAFAVNHNATIWQSRTATAPAEPLAPSATVSPIQ